MHMLQHKKFMTKCSIVNPSLCDKNTILIYIFTKIINLWILILCSKHIFIGLLQNIRILQFKKPENMVALALNILLDWHLPHNGLLLQGVPRSLP